MFQKHFLAFWLLFSALPVAAQEITIVEEKRHGQLHYNLPIGQPVTIEITYKTDTNGVVVELRETAELTALRPDGDNIVYRAKTLSAETVSMVGMPELLQETIAEIGGQAVGMSYEYAADATGYPLEIIDTTPINKFMKKARKSLKKWTKKFGKKHKLSKEQRTQVSAIVDQSLAPFMSTDKGALSQLVLESPQLIFYGTGRGLFLDYYTFYNSSRYLEVAEIDFNTLDEWAVQSWDLDKGIAEISFTQDLEKEEFEAFLGRLRTALEEQKAQNIETTIAAFRAIKMTREGSYKMDMKTGLPISGTIVSKSFAEGKNETETIEFTVSY